MKTRITILVIAILLAVGLVTPKPAEATYSICNALPWLPQCNPSPSPSPSPSPTASPVPSVEPTATPEPTVEPSETPVPEETPVPSESPEATPVVTPIPEFSQPGPGSAPSCPDVAPVLLPANAHVYRKGANAIVKWFPTGGNKANVYYYQNQNKSNAHAVRDTENDGYVEIGSLGNLDWTFQVQQSNGCAAGGRVTIVDGNTRGWVLFR